MSAPTSKDRAEFRSDRLEHGDAAYVTDYPDCSVPLWVKLYLGAFAIGSVVLVVTQ